MDLKKKIYEFRQLQACRKNNHNKKKKPIKMEFTANVKLEPGSSIFRADITVTLGRGISILEQTAVNGLHRRNLFFIAEEVATFDSDENVLQINFEEGTQKPEPMIFLENVDERKGFERALKMFLEHSNPEEVNS